MCGLVWVGKGCMRCLSLHSDAQEQVPGRAVLSTSPLFACPAAQVFRTNQSYDRWWEARKIWGGILNRVRDITTQVRVLLDISCSISATAHAGLPSSRKHQISADRSTPLCSACWLHSPLRPPFMV